MCNLSGGFVMFRYKTEGSPNCDVTLQFHFGRVVHNMETGYLQRTTAPPPGGF